MTADTLLLHLGRDGSIAANGNAEAATVAAVVPGDEVALHWLELPEGLSPAQAAAAARLLVADLSAQPIEEAHVAVGPAGEGAWRCVALVSAARLSEWIARCQEQGYDPDIVLPEPLLLLPRDERIVRHGNCYRSHQEAFCLEPELAKLLLNGSAIEELDSKRFEAEAAEAVARRPVNLRQGSFAKRRRWRIDWKQVRRLAVLAMAILLVSLAIQLTLIFRYTFAADRLETELTEVAAGALPAGTRVSNPSRQLDQRLTELQGSGVGFGSIASGLFGALRATPNVELTALSFDNAGMLRAAVAADSPATISALVQRIEAAGWAAGAGPLQSVNGRQAAEITVRAR